MSKESKVEKNCYEIVAKSLAKQGIDLAYGVIGIPVTQLAYEFQKTNIRYIGMRNEQTASLAAGVSGYLKHKPCVCLTVSAPGFINALSGLANATTNGFPMILISGSANTSMAGAQQGDFQEFDQLSAAKSFAKSTMKITDINNIHRVISRAVRIASSNRPGGVYIDIPSDVLHKAITVDIDDITIYGKRNISNCKIAPDYSSIKQVTNAISKAKKPLIIIGKGASYSRAENSLQELVNYTKIPFISSSMGRGVISDSNDLSDLAIFFGARINWMFSHGSKEKWNENCKFVQIDIHEDEFDSNVHINVPILEDCNLAAELILQEIKNTNTTTDTSSWVSAINEIKAKNTSKLLQKVDYNKVPMTFISAFFAIKNIIEKHEKITIVNEGANTLDIGRMILPIKSPRCRLDSGTWGTMGIGMPYAIAAAICNESPVLAIEGDSAFGFSGMEIETICRYNLPVVILIMNNGGIYKGDAESFYKNDPSPGNFMPNESYEKMIEAFGGDKYVIRNTKELQEKLDLAIHNKKPAILNCLIDKHDGSESGHLKKRN